jgi:hypothetical protein
MTFTLEIACDNAAFEGGHSVEIARILNRLAKQLSGEELHVGDEIKLRDANGNTVGQATLIDA